MPRLLRLNRPPNARAIIDWTGVPPAFVGRVSAVVRNSYEAEDLARWFGSPHWVPAKPVLLLLPGQPTYLGLNADGSSAHMTAAQLRDQAIAVMESIYGRARQDTKGLVLRERGGPVDPNVLRGRVMKAQIRQALERGELA